MSVSLLYSSVTMFELHYGSFAVQVQSGQRMNLNVLAHTHCKVYVHTFPCDNIVGEEGFPPPPPPPPEISEGGGGGGGGGKGRFPSPPLSQKSWFYSTPEVISEGMQRPNIVQYNILPQTSLNNGNFGDFFHYSC